jgi:hypothetical protein
MICACAVTQAFAGGAASNSGEPEQPASQPGTDTAPQSAVAAQQSSQPATTASDADAKPSTSAKTSTSQSPAAASTATTPADKPAKVVLVDTTLTDAQVKQLLAKGYRPQARGGDVYYCRREAELGSHFEKKVCKTAEQIKLDELQSKEMTEKMQRSMTSPTGN